MEVIVLLVHEIHWCCFDHNGCHGKQVLNHYLEKHTPFDELFELFELFDSHGRKTNNGLPVCLGGCLNSLRGSDCAMPLTVESFSELYDKSSMSRSKKWVSIPTQYRTSHFDTKIIPNYHYQHDAERHTLTQKSYPRPICCHSNLEDKWLANWKQTNCAALDNLIRSKFRPR